MGNSIFSIGITGLAAAQAGLTTAGHNIANVNTPNFSRQQAVQSSSTPQFSGVGYFGTGVQVDTVRRLYDQLLSDQVRESASIAAASAAHLDHIVRIDDLLADPLSGLSPAMDGFFAGVHDVSSLPSDASARQNLISGGQTLAGRFRELDRELNTLRRNVNDRIATGTTVINTLAARIAELNDRISVAASASGGRQPPNDLMDQRDAIVEELSAELRVMAVQQDDGTYSVFLGNGQPLVIGNRNLQVVASADGGDPENLRVGLSTGGGVVQFTADTLGGGRLAGLMEFRDTTLTQAQNEIGRVAAVLAESFNARHRLGLDRNGAFGADFFSVSGPQVLTTSAASVTASVADASALKASDYRLKYDGTNWTATRLADGQTTAIAGFPATIDGVTLGLSGVAAANDTFLIRPVRAAAGSLGVTISDTSRIAAALPLRSTTLPANAGNARISGEAVSSAYAAAPFGAAVNLVHDASTGTFSGFPGAVTVTSGGVQTTYAAGVPVPYTSGASYAFSGVTITISGTPADGDTLRLEPNTGATGDNRNAALLANLQTATLVDGATLQEAYGSMVSSMGNRTHALEIARDSQQNLLSQADAARQAVSGVNLDEEAANLVRFQQAYQASGKLISIASELFQIILSMGR